jgi:hypothetical protein
LVKKDFPLDRAIMIAALLNSVQIGDEPQGSVFGHTVFADKLAEPDQLAVDPPVPRPDSRGGPKHQVVDLPRRGRTARPVAQVGPPVP